MTESRTLELSVTEAYQLADMLRQDAEFARLQSEHVTVVTIVEEDPLDRGALADRIQRDRQVELTPENVNALHTTFAGRDLTDYAEEGMLPDGLDPRYQIPASLEWVEQEVNERWQEPPIPGPPFDDSEYFQYERAGRVGHDILADQNRNRGYPDTAFIPVNDSDRAARQIRVALGKSGEDVLVSAVAAGAEGTLEEGEHVAVGFDAGDELGIEDRRITDLAINALDDQERGALADRRLHAVHTGSDSGLRPEEERAVREKARHEGRVAGFDDIDDGLGISDNPYDGNPPEPEIEGWESIEPIVDAYRQAWRERDLKWEAWHEGWMEGAQQATEAQSPSAYDRGDGANLGNLREAAPEAAAGSDYNSGQMELPASAETWEQYADHAENAGRGRRPESERYGPTSHPSAGLGPGVSR